MKIHSDNDQKLREEDEDVISLDEPIELDMPIELDTPFDAVDPADEDDVTLLADDEPPTLAQMTGRFLEVSEAQIEAALAKVIRETYTKKIELIISESQIEVALEKVIHEIYTKRKEPMVSDTQIETALVKVIHGIYGEKLERMIVDAIEDFTTSEMDRIKSAVLEEDDRGVEL